MRLRLLGFVVGLQTAWLLGTAVVAQRSLVTGQIVRVETLPVDPRDLLRGDYVILNYAFSRIPGDQFEPPVAGVEGLRPGAVIYVELAPEGEFYRMTRASLEPIVPPAGHVLLRGRATRSNPGNPVLSAKTSVDYGIEQFYVPEGTGRPRGNLTVDLSIQKSGRAMVREVYVDGAPYVDAMRHQQSDSTLPPF